MQELISIIEEKLGTIATKQHSIISTIPSTQELLTHHIFRNLPNNSCYWIVEHPGRIAQIENNMKIYEDLLKKKIPLHSLKTVDNNTLLSLLEKKKTIYLLSLSSFEKFYPSPRSLKNQFFPLSIGKKINIEALQDFFTDWDLERDYEVTSQGQYALRGGIIDFFPPMLENPIRLELFGEEIVSLRYFDPLSQISFPQDELLTEKGIILKNTIPQSNIKKTPLTDYIKKDSLIIFDTNSPLFNTIKNNLNPSEKTITFSLKKPKNALLFNFSPLKSYRAHINNFLQDLEKHAKKKTSIHIISNQKKRLRELIRKRIPLNTQSIHFSNRALLVPGWHHKKSKNILFTDYEIFGVLSTPSHKKAQNHITDTNLFITLKEGCYVTHINYGIAKFLGFSRQTVNDITREYLTLEFAGGDKVFLPTSKIDHISKYLGTSEYTPELSRLRGKKWNQTRKKVKKAIDSFSKDLMQIYAQRFERSGFAFPRDDYMQKEIALSFPYMETPDQVKAWQEVKEDMESPQPMDRLICGDVGFGKTEIALRASVKGVLGGKQVVILCPTTILAKQHYNSFRERLKPYPFSIAPLTRFQSAKEQEKTLKKLKNGSIDIVIGTHRLLQKDIEIKNLGLLIVDEEQRFGVKAKDILKKRRVEVDTLSLSATPIPRTLHLSLSGIRNISVLSTPPLGRLPIETIVTKYSEKLVRKAIVKEIERGGQVIILYNKVASIQIFARKIASLVPETRVSFAHGQMKTHELEEQIYAFSTQKTDVLIATTIIENGIDIPTANTLIVMHANHFGLSDLYQIRGRVGRSHIQAYAYFLYTTDKLIKKQKYRLQALEELSELGSGFEIAVRDLDMRGSGNIFGTTQSGHINDVGFEMYCRMMKKEIRKMKKQESSSKETQEVMHPETESLFFTERTSIDLPLSAFIPSSFITNSTTRLHFYQQLGQINSIANLETTKEELIDRFGTLPHEVETLFNLEQLRLQATRVGITKISKKLHDISIEFNTQISIKDLNLKEVFELHSNTHLIEQGFVLKKLLIKSKKVWQEILTNCITSLKQVS
jgi:transcription-repair coupling factor (superfamily II helicase)